MAFGDVVQSNSGLGTVATVAPTLGAGVTLGNLVVLQYAADDYNGTPNAGWTQSTGMEQQTFHGGYIWWFIATSNGQTIPSYTIGSASRSHWTLVEYAGPFDASPYDISNGQFQQAAANNYTTPAVTPTAGGRLILAGMNFQHAASDLGTPATWLNSFTQSISVVQNGANPRLAVGQAKLVVTASGSTAYSSGATLNVAQVAQSESGLIIAFKQGASGSNGSVTAVRAVASAAVLPPAVSAGANVTVTAVPATATAAVRTPVVAGVRNATVAAVPTLASAVFEIPAVEAEVAISGGGPATASAVFRPPTVTVTGSATVTAVRATATAAVLPPVVAASGSVTVTAVAATASAMARPPVVTATRSATVAGVRAAASAAVLPPTVAGQQLGNVTVQAVAAQAYAAALAPILTAVRSANVAGVAAAATATVPMPTVIGTDDTGLRDVTFTGSILTRTITGYVPTRTITGHVRE